MNRCLQASIRERLMRSSSSRSSLSWGSGWRRAWTRNLLHLTFTTESFLESSSSMTTQQDADLPHWAVFKFINIKIWSNLIFYLGDRCGIIADVILASLKKQNSLNNLLSGRKTFSYSVLGKIFDWRRSWELGTEALPMVLIHSCQGEDTKKTQEPFYNPTENIQMNKTELNLSLFLFLSFSLSLSAVDCLDPSCSDHGSCLHGQCHCFPEWTGSKCESQVSLCPEHCSSGAVFENKACECEPNWTGLNCSAGEIPLKFRI